MRIAVIHTAFIGDLILLSPLFDALQEMHSQAEITLLTTPAGASLYRDDSRIASLVVYDKNKKDRGLKALWSKGMELRATRPQLLISAHRSLRSALLAKASGAKTRIAYQTAVGRFLYTNLKADDRSKHECRRILNLVDRDKTAIPRLARIPREAAKVSGLLEQYGITAPVILAPASVWETKQWPLENFRILAEGLSQKGYHVVVTGAESDQSLCEQISAGADRVTNFAGMLTLRESCELMRHALLALVNDSAPLHLAQAAGVPTWAMFGSTVPAFGFGPQGPKDRIFETPLECRPCGKHGHHKCPLGTLECMVSISAEMVLAEVLHFLRAEPTDSSSPS